jgi:hypothetical protein
MNSKWIKDLNIRSETIPIQNRAIDLSTIFSKDEFQMPQKQRKKSLLSLAIKEMQIKTTVRFHLIPVRIPIIKNNNNNKCW